MSVFHLKYRPTKIAELDLIDVGKILKNFLEAKEIPQSFLFSGPKGAGKTSAARILARAINCNNRKEGEPCDKCDNCKEILSNRALDIIEMDAASNRGIEDVRNLKDKAYLSPSKLKYKVFIIDEVHMMTKDAFNALLKLIEEPPKHTIFILCTTDVEKIPETVMSRLVRVDFSKGSKKELRLALDKIVKGEKMELDEKTINFILDKSDGSFRNLHKSLNEIFLSFGNKISFEEVYGFYIRKSGSYNETDFEIDLYNKKIELILEKIENMADDGVDMGIFRQKLLDYFHQKVLFYFGVEQGEKSFFSLSEIEILINLLIRAAKQEKETEIDQLPIELAIIDFVNQVGGQVEKKVYEKKIDEIPKKEPLTMEVTGLDLNKIEQSWGNVLLSVKPFNHSVEAFLRACRPVRFMGRNLVLEVFYPFHKDRLEESKNRKIVEDGLLKAFGVEISFNCVLAKNKKEPLIIKNDTPIESISDQLSENKSNKQDLYDVAKDIFG